MGRRRSAQAPAERVRRGARVKPRPSCARLRRELGRTLLGGGGSEGSSRGLGSVVSCCGLWSFFVIQKGGETTSWHFLRGIGSGKGHLESAGVGSLALGPEQSPDPGTAVSHKAKPVCEGVEAPAARALCNECRPAKCKVIITQEK